MEVILIILLLFSSFVSCWVNLPPQRLKANLKTAKIAAALSPSSEIFDQFIDHDNPSFGTFEQRYWVNTEFWRGPGSPVILFNPGEVPAIGSNGDFTFYLTNLALTGQYAEALGGAVIVIEHRYWGESSPYTDLSPKNLKYLTIQQSVQDMVNFARNAVLPFDPSGNSTADNSPWIFVGGSYAGSLVAWTDVVAPGTFWAYHSSSAPLQAITDFWQYFYPIQQGMPSICRAILETLVDYVDGVLTAGSSGDKSSLKQMFGMGVVGHDADFASAISLPLELWQTGEPYFQPFCDAIVPTGDSVGLGPLPGYSTYVNIHYACDSLSCYDTYNPRNKIYTNTALDPDVFGGRSWDWMLCNEGFGWWQTGAPVGRNTIKSRLVTASYFQRQCNLMFPGVSFDRTADEHNIEYMGWNIQNTTRVLFSTGEFDPWRSAGVSSEFRPGGPIESTPETPVFIGKDAIHCQDLYMNNPTPEVLALRVQEIDQMKSWVKEYYEVVRTRPSSSSLVSSTISTVPTGTSSPLTTSVSVISSPKPTVLSSTINSRSSTLVTPTTRLPAPATTSITYYNPPRITYNLPTLPRSYITM